MAGTPKAQSNFLTPVASVGQAVAGEEFALDSSRGAAPSLPTCRPNAPYFLAVHPSAWNIRFDDSGNPLLMPSLNVIPARPGVDGNSDADRFRPAVGAAANRGWTCIDHHLGPKGKSYLRKIQSVFGVTYVTCFDRVYAGSDTISCDRKSLHAWIWALVDNGTIPGPSIQALREERRKLARSHGKAMSTSKVSHEGAERAKMIEGGLKVIDDLIAKMAKAEAPLDLTDSEGVSLD